MMKLLTDLNLMTFYEKIKDIFVSKTEMSSELAMKSDRDHNHDNRYYTESEVDERLNNKSSITHAHTSIASNGNATVQADSDASSTSEYALIKAGHNELKVMSSGGGTNVTKGQDKLTFNGNVVYHAGKKPTATDVGARANTWLPSWSEIKNIPATFTPTLGTTNTTAFRGDHGNIAYTHSQQAHAPSSAQKNSDITKAEIEAKLTGSITSHNHNGQYYTKGEIDGQMANKAAASHMHDTLLSTNLAGKTVSLNSYNLASGSPNMAYYHCNSDGEGSNITGRPNDNYKFAFYLRVELVRWISSSDYASMQTYVAHNENAMFIRYCRNGTWTGWEKVYTTGKKPTASEVGARPSNWIPSWTEINNRPGTFTPTLGTTNTTAFRGDHGNIAYQHSQSDHAPSNAQRNADITKGEIEAKLTGSITTHNHNGQYYTKAEVDAKLPGKITLENGELYITY